MHAFHHGVDRCGFRRTIGAMKQQQAIRLAAAGELPKLHVDGILDALLPDQIFRKIAMFKIEQFPAAIHDPHAVDILCTVMLKDIEEVAS